MKYFCGIPCLYGATHTQEAIESVVHHPDVHLLLIDNGAEISVKELINSYKGYPNVSVIHNEVNQFVNPAWNSIIQRFLESDCDYVMIMNSDLILHKDWKEVLDRAADEFSALIPVPVITNDKGILNNSISSQTVITEVFEGPPGVLIILNKEQAKLIYPIPSTLLVWFGDSYLYNKLRENGYHTCVLNNLFTYHSGSQNVSKVPGIAEIIELDKLAWAKIQEDGAS